MGLELPIEHQFDTVTCCACGMVFAAPSNWIGKRREKHDTFYCPAGHNLHFPGKSDAEVLREQLEREKRRHEFTRNELAQTEKRRRAEKGAKTRIKNRIAGGACPCCNRTFENLGRHMATKHPDFATNQEAS